MDMVGLLLSEAHRYLNRVVEKLDVLQVFDGMSLGVHILGYTCIVLFLFLTFIVWRITGVELPSDKDRL